MPLGYLITVLVVGAFTVVALAPPSRPWLAARLGYLLGMTVNEVPHLAVGLPLATATATAIAEGDLSLDRVSLVLLAAAAMVGLGIIALAHRGTRAWGAVSAGLASAGIAPATRPRGWVWRCALAPFPLRPRGVARVADLAYGPHRRQRLDLYHRRDLPTGGPVLVYLHGGGYFSGGKHWEGRALLHRLADRGWVCISANYRLRPKAGFEEHLADARAALAWAREHAAGYGGDPGTLVMAGSSAGAHLTSLCALDPDERLSAAICLYGYYGRYYGRAEGEAIPSTPFALPADAAPPFLIAHGDRDTYTSATTAMELAGKLRGESPHPVVGVELPGGQHGFDLLASWRYRAVLAGVDAFLARLGIGAPLAREVVGQAPGSPTPTTGNQDLPDRKDSS